MRVGVLGLGLIGGSVARQLAPEHDVRAWDVDPATRALAAAAGLALDPGLAPPAPGRTPPDPDPAPSDPGLATPDPGPPDPGLATPAPEPPGVSTPGPDPGPSTPPGPEVTVLATPMDALPAALATAPGHILTDVGSVKLPVLAAARRAGVADRYVGGHPMAGAEHTGFAAADPALLDGAVWVLCLEPDTDLDRWLTVAALVTGTGCRVLATTAARHDEAQARISGLPHLLASALAAAGAAGGPLAGALAAGSFRDGTRVAGARPEFIAALCDGNRAALAEVLDSTLGALARARDALRAGGTVLPLAVEGARARRSWAEPGPAEPVRLDRDAPTLRTDLLALGAAGGWLDTASGPVLHGRRPGG